MHHHNDDTFTTMTKTLHAVRSASCATTQDIHVTVYDKRDMIMDRSPHPRGQDMESGEVVRLTCF